MTNHYRTCDNCAVAIVNGDYSGIDQDTDYERVTAFIERSGYLSHVGPVDGNVGYWECAACDQVEIGPGQLFESVDMSPHVMAAHVQETAEQAARQAAMHRHPSVVAKRLAAAKAADQYAEHRDDTMPTADEIADMRDWANR